MKLTRLQRGFLEFAGMPRATVDRVMLSSRGAYWWVKNEKGRRELRGTWGDALCGAGFLERTEEGDYRITDAGRAAIAEPTDGTAVTQ